MNAMGAQPAAADPNCPGLKLDIGIPDDLVRPQPNVLLDMKLTNVGDRLVWLPAGSPDFWSYEFELRDAEGNLVPRTLEWMRALSERPTVDLSSISIPIAAGVSLIRTVMLEKLFGLSKPGQYTLRVSFTSFACGKTGAHSTSNLIHFTVGAPFSRTSTSRAGISVTVSATRPRLPMGWGAPLDIIVQNNTAHPLR